LSASNIAGFAPSSQTKSSSTSLSMSSKDEELLRWAKASRSASSEDTVVELNRPLGLVLSADDDGNVYVETVAPKGNAARTGQVRSTVCANPQYYWVVTDFSCIFCTAAFSSYYTCYLLLFIN
jgi:hypothetical protein